MDQARVSFRLSVTGGRIFRKLLNVGLLIVAVPAGAASFQWDIGEEPLKGTVNTSIQAGVQVRTEKQASDLIGKVNLNPKLCPRALNGAGTTCQGHTITSDPTHGPSGFNLNSFVGEGPGVNELYGRAPGAYSNNIDDGDLNYNRGDVTQAVGRVTSDLTLSYKNYGLFTRALYFYDVENQSREIFHPNMGTLHAIAVNGAKGHTGDRGEPGFTKQSGAVEDSVGHNLQLLEANIFGTVPFFGGRELSWRIGRQPINWGESTILIINSLNTFNPPNANNLTRPAFLDLAEVLTPIGAVKLATSITENLNAEAFYQYDWQQAEAPAPGSFLSTIDVGTRSKHQFFNLGFGKAPEDPFDLGIADQVMLSAITDTKERVPLTEINAPKGGQYGLTLKYYAANLNGGTELGFYAANYHSRLPYFSTQAGRYGCLSGPNAAVPAADNPLVPSAKGLMDIVTVLQACPGADSTLFTTNAAPGGVIPARQQVIGPNGNAFAADSIRGLLEYPKNIALYGVSFNTTLGDFSIQGEVAYRPKAPLQVANTDLVFAALQNSLPFGTKTGGPDDRFDFGVPGVGTIAQLPGDRYTVPDFISKYRGRDPFSYRAADPATGTPGERIRGWEYFKTAEYNVGGTYIVGPGNWFKASQILLFGELGATQVFDLPGIDTLQIEGPATFTHASAGADGSGANGDKLANSPNLGPSGIRFNPTQQKDGWATDFSWGYRIISIFRYDNVFPGISFENTVIWAQDISGIAPGPAGNFIEGRKNAIINSEMRFGQGWSTALAYSAFFGGGSDNLLRDRDFVQAGIRYRF